jgi:hypothetical protein
MHMRQALRVISLLDEILAKKVKDNTKLGTVGRLDKTVSRRRWTLKPTMTLAPRSGVART